MALKLEISPLTGWLTEVIDLRLPLAIGPGATATGTDSIALGTNVTASGDWAVAIGEDSTATGWDDVALGYNADATGGGSFAWGDGSLASGEYSLAMGRQAKAVVDNATALGDAAYCAGTFSLALAGGHVEATSTESFAFGLGASVTGTQSVGFPNAYVEGDTSVAFPGASITGNASYCFGAGTVNANYSALFNLESTGRTLAQANTFSIMGATVGIGSLTPAALITVQADKTGFAASQANIHLSLRGATTTTKELILGLDTTNDDAIIQARNFGIDYLDLQLNPSGGNIAVGGDFLPLADSTHDLGSSSLYFAEAYLDRTYFNGTAYIDGATAGKIRIQADVAVNVDPATTSHYIEAWSQDGGKGPLAGRTLNNASSGTNIRLMKGRGTISAPLRARSGDVLCGVNAFGYYAANDTDPGLVTATAANGNFQYRCAESFTSTAKGTNFQIGLCEIGSTTITTALAVLNSRRMGVNCTAPDRGLEVNEASGNCLRLTYNDSDGSAANYADLLVSSGGDLTITAYGGGGGQDVRIGDATPTNYTNFDSTGHQTMEGSAKPWRDELGDALSLEVSGTGISKNTAENTTDFTSSSKLSDYAYCNVQLNHDKELAGAVYPHIHYQQNQNVMPNFLLQYRWQINGNAKTTTWTDRKCIQSAFTYTTGTLNQIAYASSITAPASASISDILQFRIIRDTGNSSTTFTGSDAYSGTVAFTSFDVHFQINSLGSTDEYTK